MLIDSRRNAFDKKRKHSKSQHPCKAMKRPAEFVLESGSEALEEMWAEVDSCHTTVTEQDQSYLQQLQMENSDGCIRFIQNDMTTPVSTTQCLGYSEIVRSGKIVPPSLVLNPTKRGTCKGSKLESNKVLALLSGFGGSADESLLLRLQQQQALVANAGSNRNSADGSSSSSFPMDTSSMMIDATDRDEDDVGNTDTTPLTTTTTMTTGPIRPKDHGKNKHGLDSTFVPPHNGTSLNDTTTSGTTTSSSSSSHNNSNGHNTNSHNSNSRNTNSHSDTITTTSNHLSAPLPSAPTDGVDAHQLTRHQWLCRQLGRMLAVERDENLFPTMSSSSSSPFSFSSNGLTADSGTTSYLTAAASNGRGSTYPSSGNSHNSSHSFSHSSRARVSTSIDDHSLYEGEPETTNGIPHSSDYHALRLGKRGRRYREVWEEEDYLSSLRLNRTTPQPQPQPQTQPQQRPPQGTACAKTGPGTNTNTNTNTSTNTSTRTRARTGTGKEAMSWLSLQPLEDWSELIHAYSDTHDGYYRDWSMYYAHHIATLMYGKDNEARAAARLSANPAVKAMAAHPGDKDIPHQYTLSTHLIKTPYQCTL